MAAMTVLDTHPADAFANDRAHVFHSWSAQGALNPLVVDGGEGSYFWTQDGTRYLDFSSQLVNVNIGHQHPKLVAAIKEQADRLCTIAPFHANDARSEAARLICEVAAEKIDDSHLNMVFFTNGGAEATENAVRMARLHTGRQQGAHALPQLPRRHQRGDHADRRPAALAAASRACPASSSSGGRTRTAARSTRPARPRSASGRSPTSTTC